MRSSIPYGAKRRCGEPSHKSRGMFYPIDPSALVGRGLSISGLIEGDAIPKMSIPDLIEFFRRSGLPIGKLVTFFPFEHINRAIEEMEFELS